MKEVILEAPLQVGNASVGLSYSLSAVFISQLPLGRLWKRSCGLGSRECGVSL